MLARLSAFVVWALVGATLVFWGLRLAVQAPSAPTYAMAVGDAAAVRGDLTALLGTAPAAAVLATPSTPAPEASSRFRLLGIAAPRAGSAAPAGRGVALIAVDGKLPKAFAVGARIDPDLVLESVSLRSVSIASSKGAPAIKLELPPLAAAATGALPSALPGGNGLPGVAAPVGPIGMPVPGLVGQPPAILQQPGQMEAPSMIPQAPPPMIPRQGPNAPLNQ